MTIALAAVTADGEISDQEVSRVRAMCVLSPIFCQNSSDEDLEVIGFASNANSQRGRNALLQASQILSQELRETAVAFASDMILADGILGDSEREFLGDFAGILGVSDEIGDAVLLATIIRNREG